MENETFCIGNKDNANISLNVIESIGHQKSVNNEVIPSKFFFNFGTIFDNKGIYNIFN